MSDENKSPETASERTPDKAWVKPLSDYGPIVVFFAAYMGWDLLVATAALMAATAIALAVSLAVNKRVPLMPLITAGVVGVFGGLTLALNDDTFIKLKPTIVQALIGAVLLGGLLFDKALLKPVMGSAWPMDDAGWRKLTRNFGLFFLVMAVANEIVWRTQTTDFWVTFKVFGIMALTFAFSMTQIPILNRHRVDEEEA
ncbi:MAG: septation protein A [Proteobacteria bacterium]|nr:septation protein A [Pseudomonadota bacterium]